MELEELLRKTENNILTIKKRFYYLEAIQAEMERVTQGRRFTIRNDVVWRMMGDSYEMLVIDLASLFRGMCEKGGFFGQLKIHSRRLKRLKPEHIEATEPNILEDEENPLTPEQRERLRVSVMRDSQRRYSEGIERALVSLFPALQGLRDWKVTHDHIEALKDEFYKRSEDVIAERDSSRAHRYQRAGAAGASSGVPLEKLGEHFERLEEMMNAIRLASTNSTFGYSDMNYANVQRAAEDISDLVMLGSINRIVAEFGIPEALRRLEDVPEHYYVFRERYFAAHPAPFGQE